MPVTTPEPLRNGRDISRTLRSGSRRVRDHVVVHVDTHDDRTRQPRVAVVASRRVGGAVQRNRAKRLLREASRNVSWAAGHDVVLVARSGAHRAAAATIRREVAEAATALGVAVRSPASATSVS